MPGTFKSRSVPLAPSVSHPYKETGRSTDIGEEGEFGLAGSQFRGTEFQVETKWGPLRGCGRLVLGAGTPRPEGVAPRAMLTRPARGGGYGRGHAHLAAPLPAV